MVFVELTPFQAFRRDNWTDEDLRGLQSVLIERPDAGPLIPGAGGSESFDGPCPAGASVAVPESFTGGPRPMWSIWCVPTPSDQEDLTPDQARRNWPS
jgi:hypothetical protein